METPVLVLGRVGDDKTRIAPWRGLGSGSVSCCCFSARTAAYSAKLCEDICTTEEWEDEGRIQANAKRQHLGPSNDGLEIFSQHIPEQNPIVHQMHIFIKFVVMS